MYTASSFNNQIHLVLKFEKEEWHLMLDYHNLNAVTLTIKAPYQYY